jgi:hypothetical protein
MYKAYEYAKNKEIIVFISLSEESSRGLTMFAKRWLGRAQ